LDIGSKKQGMKKIYPQSRKKMKSIFVILFFLTLLPIDLLSQDNKCNCNDNLTKLIAKTEENYAGFPAKVNTKTNASYKKLIRTLQQKASTEQNPKSCFFLLKAYVKYFKDKHFVLSYINDEGYNNEKIAYSDTYFKNALAKGQLTEVEGIWVNADTSLKLAFQKFPNNVYKGIVLESRNPKIVEGLVYLTLTPSKNGFTAQRFNSFTTTDVPAKQKRSLLQIWNYEMFGKIYPTKLTDAEQRELNTWKNNNAGLDFQKLTSRTAYLKIPTFLNNDDKIQQLVSLNDSIIKTCENLIVDLTGNGGGNTGWVSFLPYFMTNPVIQFDTYLRTTPDNVKSKLADLEPFVINPIPIEYKKYFPENVVDAYKKAYQELPTTKKSFYPIPGVTFPLDAVLVNPKKIALLVDDFCGSSTEYFFYLSKQSKKTTTYGTNTIGMMDYEGMSNPTPLPYAKYIVTIPIVKSSWTDGQPIDQTGFKPDKSLKTVEQRYWVEHVRKELEQK
jgi:Peptidase family S41